MPRASPPIIYLLIHSPEESSRTWPPVLAARACSRSSPSPSYLWTMWTCFLAELCSGSVGEGSSVAGRQRRDSQTCLQPLPITIPSFTTAKSPSKRILISDNLICEVEKGRRQNLVDTWPNGIISWVKISINNKWNVKFKLRICRFKLYYYIMLYNLIRMHCIISILDRYLLILSRLVTFR